MKKLLFLSFTIILLSTIACTKQKANVYVRLDAISFCGNSLNNIDTTPNDWYDKVIKHLTELDFDIEDSVLGFEAIEPIETPHCGNCNPTGDYIDVLVPESQLVDLKALGFHAI